MIKRIAAAATIALAALVGCGPTQARPTPQAQQCQLEYGHSAGQAPHWQNVCR